RRIYQSVGLLKTLANTLGHREAIAKPERSKISELNEVTRALEDASRLLQGRAAERDRVEEDLRSLGRELEKRVSSRTAELSVANEILLRQAELLDLTHDAVLVRGFVAGRINLWNRGASEMYGWTSEEVIGKVFHALLQTKFPEPAEKIEERLAFIGRWEGELVQTKKDGSELTVMSRWSVRRDPDGRPIAILEVNSDITGKKQAEKKAHEAEKLATLGSTAAVFAHEIGNPLNGITASLQLALQQLKSCPDNIDDITSSLRDGVREIGRLGALLQEFRAFVRPQLLRRELTDLRTIITETINMQLPVCEAAGIKVEVLVKDVLPPVLGDAAKIKQVFLNLLKNACEAMPDGGMLIVSAYLFEETVTVEISDTGCGIPHGANIFEPFQSSKPDGMGLGLAIVRQIISAHGGTVEYASEKREGTTFKVRLPTAP
ncbi:MAG: two-component system sensor histidine kinase NtrB, partial [Gammaproteobacteria bacterium]